MKLFACQHCGNLLYFENTSCEACHHRLGYIPERETLSALEPDGDTGFVTLAEPAQRVRFCDNAGHDACNWLVDADAPNGLCAACRHNHTIPDVTDPAKLLAWRRIEMAKHRLFYTVLKLDLPVPAMGEADEPLMFDFLADPPSGPKIMTGHDNGLITLALKEADDAQRTALREAMGEPYRTLLGHFRHEVGHYYWDRLVRDGGKLDACRAVFGDDSQDYEAALKIHYAQGAPADWQERFVSAYATTHPWEDFAETWSHYLHILDTLETARSFGMQVAPDVSTDRSLITEIGFDPYRAPSAQALVDSWLPLTYAMNSLNRSMGHSDLYPFVLSAPVVAKLQFIHEVVMPS